MDSASLQQHYILITDIASSSRLWEDFPSDYPRLLDAHNRMIEEQVAAQGGVLHKNLGDGYLLLFASADACLRCAVELQRSVEGLGLLPDNSPLRMRVVAHGGRLRQLSSGGEWFGPPLNRAARICQCCHPGQLLVSRELLDGLSGDLPLGLASINLGMQRLRDLGEPEELVQVVHADFGQSEFPPLPTVGSLKGRLSEQAGTFVGRRDELDSLRRMLTDGERRLVSIVGPPGYGKSRLAAQCCAELLEHFEHGACEVLLSSLGDASRVVSAIADALGFSFHGSRAPEDQLVDFLAQRELLLYLDNFEHITDAAPLVDRILREAPRVSILVTSIVPLHLRREQLLRIEPLGIPPADMLHEPGEAIALFVDRAQQADPDFELDADNALLVQQVCHRLEGVPLAIELAAAWLDSFSLEELRDELGGLLDLQSRHSDMPQRHSSVRASCEWSYGHLTTQQQELLQGLSVFRGGFSHEQLSEVLPGVTRMQLSALVDRSWLVSRRSGSQTRFMMRDAASRRFANEQLEASGRQDEVLRAHAASYSRLIARLGEQLKGAGQIEALARLRPETENFYLAIETAIRLSDNELLAPLVRYLARFQEMATRQREQLQWFRRLHEYVERSGSDELKVQVLLGLARVLERDGHLPAARRVLRELAGLLLESEDLESRALACWLSGCVNRAAGDNVGAKMDFVRAMSDACDGGDLWTYASASISLASVYLRSGDRGNARRLYQQALDTDSGIGNQYGIAAALTGLALIARAEGRYRDAQRMQDEAIAIQEELGERYSLAGSLNNQGLTEYRIDNFARALELLERSRAIREDLADRRGVAHCLGNMGLVSYVTGDFEKALEYAERSMAISRELDDRYGIAACLCDIAAASLRLGRRDSLDSLLSSALADALELGGERLLATALLVCGLYLREQDDNAGVERIVAAISAWTAKGATLARVEQMHLDELAEGMERIPEPQDSTLDALGRQLLGSAIQAG
ncbi:tetratricopeptide repeat protein [bacterium]|nr:tetratricopeptide repeat protein [bacterium]